MNLPRVSVVRPRPLLTVLLAFALGLTAGCSREPAGSSEVEVAQVAVRANPALELVATDADQGVLTVRVRSTGHLLTVKAADVNAGTAFASVQMEADGPAHAGDPAALPVAPTTASGSAPAQEARAAEAAPPPARAGAESAAGIRVSAERRGEAGDARADRRADVSTGGVGVSARSSGTGDRNVVVNTPAGAVTAQRNGGSAQVTTPQASVTRQGDTSQVRVPASGVTVTKDAGTGSSSATVVQGGGWVSQASPGQRHRAGPASCRQGEVASIANANLEVADGVALTVETGCVMTVRGSRIAGGDTAVVVKMGGTLTVESSTIEGRKVAVQFDMGSTGTLRGSTFHGSVAKANGAVVTDQGNRHLAAGKR